MSKKEKVFNNFDLIEKFLTENANIGAAIVPSFDLNSSSVEKELIIFDSNFDYIHRDVLESKDSYLLNQLLDLNKYPSMYHYWLAYLYSHDHQRIISSELDDIRINSLLIAIISYLEMRNIDYEIEDLGNYLKIDFSSPAFISYMLFYKPLFYSFIDEQFLRKYGEDFKLGREGIRNPMSLENIYDEVNNIGYFKMTCVDCSFPNIENMKLRELIKKKEK